MMFSKIMGDSPVSTPTLSPVMYSPRLASPPPTALTEAQIEELFEGAIFGQGKLIEKIGINYQNKKGDTLLHVVAREYDRPGQKMEELLYNFDPNPNIKNLEGKTPLIASLEYDDAPFTSSFYLINILNADVNAVDKEGNNILHYLMGRYSRRHFSKFLGYYLGKGANPTVKNLKGKTPTDILKENLPQFEKDIRTRIFGLNLSEIEKRRRNVATSIQMLEKAAAKFKASQTTGLPRLSLLPTPTVPTSLFPTSTVQSGTVSSRKPSSPLTLSLANSVVQLPVDFKPPTLTLPKPSTSAARPTSPFPKLILNR